MEMTKSRWIALGIALAAVALAIAWAAVGYGGRYCMALKAANAARDAKDKIAPLDCAEFWFNRYQSAWSQFIAAGVALFAAGIAWRAVQTQTKAQREATQIAEAALWEGRADAATRAGIALSTMDRNMMALAQARMAHPLGQNVNLAAIQQMKATGFYPFSYVELSVVGSEGLLYSHLADLLTAQVGRLDRAPGHDTLIVIDRAIGGAFQLVPAVEAAIKLGMARQGQQLRAAQEALARLGFAQGHDLSPSASSEA